MNFKVFKLSLIAAGILLGSTGQANATDTLISELGGQVVYDATTNLSWIADANLATTNTFGVSGINSDGTMNWSTAQNWIAAMDAANYLGYSDWRLPTSDTCISFNCTGSEMGNLFYNGLGQVAGSTITTTHNGNYSLFNNVQSNIYWSGTVYAQNTNSAWNFNTNDGNQNAYNKGYGLFALAVRSGQVAAVPEPENYGMMLGGLGLLCFMARRKKSL